ncbi:hypothetical protein B0A48_18763 [Cryoendolithus antarcticus]|uniref:Uncharacterized protein n=1 Tax=Cryoendolithus antarcticus TaxID=1507870 RepID=A0A1V8S887_9PEZI|nr:hypothetical protein B0A48_18763 [Cryoendolithus antarcticus]
MAMYSSTENYGDYGSDTVDWLVNDDASSTTSFGDAITDLILQDSRTEDELEQILEANGCDLSQTINALMESQGMPAKAMAAAIQQLEQQ